MLSQRIVPPFSSVCALTVAVAPRRARGIIRGRASARSSSSRFSLIRRPASTLSENASSESSASERLVSSAPYAVVSESFGEVERVNGA